MKFVQVSIDNEHSMTLFEDFYESLYLPNFLDPNERESRENIINYLRLKKNGWYQKNNYHVLLLIEENKVKAGAIIDYLERANCGIIEFLVTSKSERRKGLGKTLYSKILKILKDDAKRNKKEDIDFLLIEVDDPEKTDKKYESFDPKKRMKFWEKAGFSVLNFTYIQPSLSYDKKPVESLNLLTNIKRIESRKLIYALEDYAKFAMGIENPNENKEIIKMKKEIELYKTIKTLS